MNVSLRVGLVGCGVITQRTAAGICAILKERNAAITALCDPLDANIGKAARLVGAGDLGAIVSVDATAEAAPHRYEPERAEEAPDDGQRYSWEWYHRKELGGGPLDDMFVYPLAFLTAVFGEVEDARVFGQLLTPVIEWRGRRVEATAADCYAGVIRFAGATATIRSSFSSNTQYIPWGTVVIRGTEAALEIIKHDDLEYSLFMTPNSGAPAEEKLPVFSPDEQQRFGTRECHILTDIREFVDSILEHRPVRGATAGNAARVAAALRLIEDGG